MQSARLFAALPPAENARRVGAEAGSSSSSEFLRNLRSQSR